MPSRAGGAQPPACRPSQAFTCEKSSLQTNRASARRSAGDFEGGKSSALKVPGQLGCIVRAK
ncbi:hypothetical protein FJ546_08080 [Mesorhizobium sp. B2-4-19]|nr:hypothetical protein FJ546_08080 [Mesorhizobium sp. B2-4-19]